jgi:hypothetical protein
MTKFRPAWARKTHTLVCTQTCPEANLGACSQPGSCKFLILFGLRQVKLESASDF